MALPAIGQFQTAPPTYQQPQQYPPQQQYPQPYPVSGQPEQYPQGPDTGAADQQHGVARLSVAQGDVNVKRGDNGQVTAALLNAPLLAHDHVETAPGSRAEIEMDSSNVIRLAPDSDLAFADLEYQRYQAQLGIGTIIVRMLRASQSQIEIDTPSVALHPLGQGEYRISVFDNGTTQVTVRSGRLEMSGARGSQLVNAGQSLLVRGDSSDPEFQDVYQLAHDQFDDWSASRDNELLASRSYQYVSADIPGAEDLDRYGNWVPSEYGQAWSPQGMSSDWSPYSNGQWSWADYYGWTWVDYSPWGWAPYHYGRWFWNTGYGWCWYPGARGGYYHWSPALVGFFGFGSGLGWVALAPFEVFHPWWGRGYGGFGYERIEVGRFYRNAGIRGGAMTASFGGFGGAGHRFNVATRGQLSGASLIRGQVPVTPNAGSYRFTDRPAFSSQRLSQAANRQFFSSARQFNPANNRPSAARSGGWQSFGSPGNMAPLRQNFSNGGARAESGWHSFGQAPQAAPSRGSSSYGPAYSAPRNSFSAPQAQHYNYSAPAPRYNAPAPSFNRGGGGASAPRYSAPHYSAPANRGGGGGGGGGRSSGGGSHGGGGGGGRHGR